MVHTVEVVVVDWSIYYLVPARVWDSACDKVYYTCILLLWLKRGARIRTNSDEERKIRMYVCVFSDNAQLIMCCTKPNGVKYVCQ